MGLDQRPGQKLLLPFAAVVAPGDLALGPDGRSVSNLYSKQHLSVAVGHSLQSRSAEAATRLETRTKESNMCASFWVV